MVKLKLYILFITVFFLCSRSYAQKQNENPLVGVWQLIGVDGKINDHTTLPSGKIPGTISYKIFS